MDVVSWVTSNSDLFISLPPKPNFDHHHHHPKKSVERLPLPISIPENQSSTKTDKHKQNQSSTKRPDSRKSINLHPESRISIGESGVSYLLPGAPFEFQYSYTEIPNVKPLAIRVPQFFPFAEQPKPRPWTGKITRKTSLLKVKKIRLFDCTEGTSSDGDDRTYLQLRQPFPVRVYMKDKRSREEILGDPLSKDERNMLIDKYNRRRQVNLGRDGVTHNMLEIIHGHWTTGSVCKLRCRGVPTVDMDNICHQLEEKTKGKVIFCWKGTIYLFRGRNYDPRTRPRFPRMLWRPTSPIYPDYIQKTPEGLSEEEAEMLRKKGNTILPICSLGKNNIYVWLVKFIRKAFEELILVKIDCRKLNTIDYIKLSIKLQDLVPCVLLSYENGQILLWRGASWKSKYTSPPSGCDAHGVVDGIGGGGREEEVWEKMNKAWKHAIETKEATVLQ